MQSRQAQLGTVHSRAVLQNAHLSYTTSCSTPCHCPFKRSRCLTTSAAASSSLAPVAPWPRALDASSERFQNRNNYEESVVYCCIALQQKICDSDPGSHSNIFISTILILPITVPLEVPVPVPRPAFRVAYSPIWPPIFFSKTPPAPTRPGPSTEGDIHSSDSELYFVSLCIRCEANKDQHGSACSSRMLRNRTLQDRTYVRVRVVRHEVDAGDEEGKGSSLLLNVLRQTGLTHNPMVSWQQQSALDGV